MAKKKQDLSKEELLTQALIPEDEQPYKVPNNWVWVRFGFLAKDMADGPFGSNLKREHYTEKKEVRIIQLSNIGEDGWRDENRKYTTYEHAKTISRSLVNSGDIVIAKMMPAGRAIKVPYEEKAYILSSDAVKFVPKNFLNTDYLLYAINSNDFRNQISSETQGITRARTSIGKMKTYAFPLPPIPEQQRIVDRIESLFVKLDQAKELVQEAFDSFENRKAAILHKAFTGELTKKWREENGVRIEAWREIKLKDCGKWYGGGTPSKTVLGYWSNGNIMWVTPKDMKSKYIEDTIDHITYRGVQESSTSFIEKPAILFVVRSGILRRILPIALSIKQITVNQDIKALVPNKIELEYLYWFCISREQSIRDTCSKSGTTVESINTHALYEYSIVRPSLTEQREIVRILNSLFEKQEKSKELVETLEQIDQIKKAILVRAFRGELGTNDLAEESAIELLEELLIS